MNTKQNDKVQENLNAILEAFESGKISEVVAISTIRPIGVVPCSHWSLLNRIFVTICGHTSDARGIRQWNEVGRKVNKGAKSFSILAPRFKKVENEETGEEETVRTGFVAVPVFAYEQTNGEPLPDDIACQSIPLPPLAEVAAAFGLSIQFQPCRSDYLGTYNRKDKITLASTDEHIYFHELAHAAHHRVDPEYEKRSIEFKEITAELTAAVISRIYGKKYCGFAFTYIRQYSSTSPHKACLKVLSEVEKALSLIFQHTELPAQVETAA